MKTRNPFPGRAIDGPRPVLNRRPDGPFAFSSELALRQYEATRWLYEYALNAVEDHGVNRADFEDADNLRRVYPVQCEDAKTFAINDYMLSAEEIGVRGKAILDAACSGASPEALEAMFDAWSDRIREG